MSGNQRTVTVSCPRCGVAVRWGAESPFRPFCSERCKMIDLGAWANEEYRVAVKGGGESDTESEQVKPAAP